MVRPQVCTAHSVIRHENVNGAFRKRWRRNNHMISTENVSYVLRVEHPLSNSSSGSGRGLKKLWIKLYGVPSSLHFQRNVCRNKQENTFICTVSCQIFGVVPRIGMKDYAETNFSTKRASQHKQILVKH